MAETEEPGIIQTAIASAALTNPIPRRNCRGSGDLRFSGGGKAHNNLGRRSHQVLGGRVIDASINASSK
jgi:hypothetical protein